MEKSSGKYHHITHVKNQMPPHKSPLDLKHYTVWLNKTSLLPGGKKENI